MRNVFNSEYKLVTNYIGTDDLSYYLIKNWITISWGFIYHGIQREYISYQFAINYACDIVDNTNLDDLDLINVWSSKEQYIELDNYINILVKKESAKVFDYEEAWLFIFLKYVSVNIDKFSNIESILAIISEDFGFKYDTKCLVYYMPKSKCTKGTITDRLDAYIKEKSKKYLITRKV